MTEAPRYTLLTGNALDILKTLPDRSVQTCVTSPPYYGLRAYEGNQDVEWPTVEYAPMSGLPAIHIQGCESGCEHEWTDGPRIEKAHNSNATYTEKQASNRGALRVYTAGAHCSKCHGWRGPLGLEPDIFAYIGHLILCLREVKRVLHDDGVCFVNLGDSYNGSGGAGGDYNSGGIKEGQPRYPGRNISSLKQKDLCGIPWRFAFAAQADGWYLRSDIVWAKGVSFCSTYSGSVMPESVRDRPSRSHEYIFLLSKSKDYYWNDRAIAEPALNSGKVISLGEKSFSKRQADGAGTSRSGNALKDEYTVPATRNIRTVWAINPHGFPGAHFATFSEALVRPMVLAGSREGDTVLDLFSGSGTTGVIAIRHNRNYIGIDTSAVYNEMARKRIELVVQAPRQLTLENIE